MNEIENEHESDSNSEHRMWMWMWVCLYAWRVGFAAVAVCISIDVVGAFFAASASRFGCADVFKSSGAYTCLYVNVWLCVCMCVRSWFETNRDAISMLKLSCDFSFSSCLKFISIHTHIHTHTHIYRCYGTHIGAYAPIQTYYGKIIEISTSNI